MWIGRVDIVRRGGFSGIGLCHASRPRPQRLSCLVPGPVIALPPASPPSPARRSCLSRHPIAGQLRRSLTWTDIIRVGLHRRRVAHGFRRQSARRAAGARYAVLVLGALSFADCPGLRRLAGDHRGQPDRNADLNGDRRRQWRWSIAAIPAKATSAEASEVPRRRQRMREDRMESAEKRRADAPTPMCRCRARWRRSKPSRRDERALPRRRTAGPILAISTISARGQRRCAQGTDAEMWLCLPHQGGGAGPALHGKVSRPGEAATQQSRVESIRADRLEWQTPSGASGPWRAGAAQAARACRKACESEEFLGLGADSAVAPERPCDHKPHDKAQQRTQGWPRAESAGRAAFNATEHVLTATDQRGDDFQKLTELRPACPAQPFERSSGAFCRQRPRGLRLRRRAYSVRAGLIG